MLISLVNLDVQDKPVLSLSLALSNVVQRVPTAFHFLEHLDAQFSLCTFNVPARFHPKLKINPTQFGILTLLCSTMHA